MIPEKRVETHSTLVVRLIVFTPTRINRYIIPRWKWSLRPRRSGRRIFSRCDESLQIRSKERRTSSECFERALERACARLDDDNEFSWINFVYVRRKVRHQDRFEIRLWKSRCEIYGQLRCSGESIILDLAARTGVGSGTR